MSIKRARGRNGFTLIEIVLALGIFVVISGMTAAFFIQGSGLWQFVVDKGDLRCVARNVMNFMTQELQKATRTTNATGGPPDLSIPAAPGNNVINFYLPRDSADANELIIDAVGVTEWDTDTLVQYQYNSGEKKLYRLENSGNQSIVANNVALIKFEDKSIDSTLYANELRITLTLERAALRNQNVTVTLMSLLKLRN